MGPKVRKRLSITDSDVNKYSSSAKKRKKLEEKSPVKKKNAEEKSVKKDNREEKSPAKKKKIENCSDQPASSQALSSSEVSDVCKKGHVRNEKSPKLKSVNCQELVAKDISITSDINSMNINQLLALGESLEIPDLENDKSSELSDSEESDFEEVKHTEIKNHEIPKEGVSVILEVPHLKRRDKKSLDAEALIKREVNKVKKGIQLLMHKVHVLCWIAHLKFVNNVLNSPPLMKSCSALVKSKNLYPPKYADLTYLEGVIKWFHKTILFEQGHAESKCIAEELLNQINQKKAHLSRDLTLIFIALLRVLGLKARIVMSFQVLPVKPTSNELLNFKAANKNEKAKEDILNNKQKISIKQENDVEHLNKTHNEVSLAQQCENDTNVKKSATTKRASKKKNELASDQGVASKEVLVSAKSDLSEKNKISSKNEDKKMKANYQSKSKKVQCISGDKESKSSFKTSKNSGTKSSTSTNKKQSESYQSEDSLSDSDDDNFVYKSLQKKVKKKVGRPSTSNNEETSATKKKEGCNVWTEVFLESEEKWISVDVQRQKVHCINELYSRATHPVIYVIACNNDSTLKDVTKRYVPHWHSDTVKKRVEEDWWKKTMLPYSPSQTAQDKEEDAEMIQQLHDKPLPAVISEFKNHPLYALKRHLLKFEAIYPPEAPTLGFVRGEPVYARECVVTLHSREMWYKQARVVRLKEEPYKIVKARPKYDKMTGEVKKDIPLELFGAWQTEEYIPPVAVNGQVPRNEYGNVDLFKPCMLPIGTVHLQIPALNRVAKKLGIDCAPATVGFEFHSGGSHPVFDGFVVCEEFKEIILDAWNKEVDESAKRSEEKKEKRVYNNWKRLIRGLLIREKLKLKYSFGENLDNETNSSSATKDCEPSRNTTA